MFKVWSASAGLLHEKCEEERPSNNKTHNLLYTLIFRLYAGPLRRLCLEFFQLN